MKRFHPPSHTCRRRRGAVLLLILVALIVAATALVSVARQSHRLGTDAVRAKRDLQQKWGTESLRRSLLPIAETVFEERDKLVRKTKGDHFPIPELPGEIQLGDTRFLFILADEDSRANVNSLYHYGDRESASAAVKELSLATGAVQLNPECESIGAAKMIQEIPKQQRGAADQDAEDDEEEVSIEADRAPIAFRSWGQVFDLNRVPGLQGVTRRLTCWGSEAINVRRADEEAIVEVAGLVMGKAKARRMVADYRKNGANEINRTIDRFSAEPKTRQQLKRLLSDSSMCYSLWVRSTRMSEVRDSFAVLKADTEGAFRTTEVEYRGQ